MTLFKIYNAVASPLDATPTDALSSINTNVEKIYFIVALFFLLWLAFKCHSIFRTIFNNLKGGH